jgi:hypothetical protein
MKYRIKSLTPESNFILKVGFDNGVQKLYNVSTLFENYPMFSDLKKFPQIFQNVSIAPQGYAAVWNDDIDLGADELYYNGKDYKTNI